MAQSFSANVYEINSVPTSPVYGPIAMGFPSAACQFLPYNGNDSRLHGLVQLPPNAFQYAVVETVAQLIIKANA